MEVDNSDKEVEVAQFMCHIKKPEKDIQKASVNAHHDRNAEQITGHAPFHQSKTFQDEPIQISSARSTMLPVLTTKSEDHSDTIDGTVELVECSDNKIERIDNFQSYDNMETIQFEDSVKNNGNNVTIYTTAAQASGHEITYIDEHDGSHIGEVVTSRHNTISTIGTVQPVAKRRILAPADNAVISSGQAKQYIIPANQQIIQIAGIDGQPGQIMIVPQGNVILIPQNTSNQKHKSNIQVQNGATNSSQQILLLSSPSQPDISPKIKLVKVSEGSPLEYAANLAGIKPSDNDTKQEVVSSREVSQQHHYPSPFSQVPVEERPHSCSFCYKRFARADECKRHERIHTDTRPFACNYCPRRFTRKDHLRTHTRCHTKEKPYICPMCERGFARSDERIRHVKTHVKKGEGTLEEIKKQMPKPKFEIKKAETIKPINGIEIKLNPSEPSVSTITQNGTDIAKAIPITVIPNMREVRTTQVRISQ